MRYISFKRAKDVKGLDLPPEMIVFHEPDLVQGMDSLPEDEFEADFALNEQRMAVWLAEKEKMKASLAASEAAEALKKKSEQREFELWKQGRSRRDKR